MADITLKRGDAADLLDVVRIALAGRCPPDAVERLLKAKYGIEPLRACDGEAHSNPYIDNCGRCAPHWGWVGPKVRIK